jgi:hypothetical protein
MDNQAAQEHFKRADELYNAKKYSEALAVLDALNESFPKTKNIVFPRARCLFKLGRLKEARILCDWLIAEFNYDKAQNLLRRIERVEMGLGDLGAGMDPLQPIPDLNEQAIPEMPPGEENEEEPDTRRKILMGVAIGFGVLIIIGLIAMPIINPPPEPVVTKEASTEATTEADALAIVMEFLVRTVIAIIILVISCIVTLYSTLVILRKLPGGGFLPDLITVSLIAAAVGIIVCITMITDGVLFIVSWEAHILLGRIVRFIGFGSAFLILHKLYDMDFFDDIVLIVMAIIIFYGSIQGIDHFVFPDSFYEKMGVIEQEILEEELEAIGYIGVETVTTTVPYGVIAIDGSSSDWASIDPIVMPQEDPTSQADYRVAALYMARDDANLYFLAELAMQGMAPLGSNFGHLGRLEIEWEDQACMVNLSGKLEPYYDRQNTGVAMVSQAEASVVFIDYNTGAEQLVSEINSDTHPASIVFSGRWIEFGVPLAQTGVPTEAEVDTTFYPGYGEEYEYSIWD